MSSSEPTVVLVNLEETLEFERHFESWIGICEDNIGQKID
jgi:hypothetical protein